MSQLEDHSKSIRRLQAVDKYSTLLDIIAIALITGYGVFNKQDFSTIEFNWLKDLVTFLFDHKIGIVLISIGVIVSKKAFYRFYLIKKQPSEFRRAVMYELLEDLFDNNRNIRVTLFKEVGTFRNIWYHFVDFLKFIYCKIEGLCGVWFCNQTPRAPKKGKYIKVFQRAGWEMKKSNTKFFYTPNTKDHCQGIAARVIQNWESIQKTDLPNIHDIDLNDIDLNDEQDPDVIKVKEYMDRSYISNIHTLKNLNSRAIHFKADAIYGESGPVGVLIIDCIEGPDPFSPIDLSRLEPYLNLIGTTFGGNIYD